MKFNFFQTQIITAAYIINLLDLCHCHRKLFLFTGLRSVDTAMDGHCNRLEWTLQ
ncbi:hypothetical protein HanPI659440_Chr04g0174561 [Helianthus annuus]|nr:hypothetical protein HanPI659440_Chr04g0174561 [Helianthus annuus]